MSNHQSKRKKSTSLLLLFLTVISLLSLALAGFIYAKSIEKDEVEVLTRDGVVTQIKELSRLQTVVFGVDTVITSKKEGTWYSLWQDKQKGLFVAHGRVNAGIDLSQLTPAQVQVTPISADVDSEGQAIVESDSDLNIHIKLPPAQIFDVYLDEIEVYDLQTGLFGVMKTDPAIFEKAQASGKQEVLKMACRGDVLQMATDNGKKQIESLFKLTGAQVTVETQTSKDCDL